MFKISRPLTKMYLNFFPKQYFDSHCGALCIVDKASAYGAKGPGFTTRWKQQFIFLNVCSVEFCSLIKNNIWSHSSFVVGKLKWDSSGILAESFMKILLHLLQNSILISGFLNLRIFTQSDQLSFSSLIWVKIWNSVYICLDWDQAC